MNSNQWKPRTLTQTLTLLCEARGGNLLRAGALNQSEIARQAGTKQANISRWFDGLATPTDENIKKLAKLFKVTPAQMRGEEPIMTIDGYLAKSPEDEIFMIQYQSLPDEAKNVIREQVALYKKLSDR